MFSTDRHFQVRLSAVFAWLMWAKVLADLIVFGLTGAPIWAACSVVCAAAAGTLHVRSWFCVMGSRMTDVFEAGRIMGRQEERVRELHSV